jgi:TetR/AcrR family transcriptional regulator
VLALLNKPKTVLPNSLAMKISANKTKGGEANRERILEAGLSVFAIDGFAGTRIDAIAALAGLSKPNLLYYYRTKADLYLAILRKILDIWLHPLQSMDVSDDPKAALAQYITRKLEHARDYPEASRLFAMEIMRGAPILNQILASDLKELVDAKVLLLSRWMDEGKLARKNPHHLLFMIWATTQHYADFSTQVETLTGKSLKDAAFFEETKKTLLGLFAH